MEEKGGKREDCGTAPRTSWWLHQDALLSGGSRHGRHQQGASERRASPPAPEPPRCSLPLQVPRRPGRGCGMPAPSRAAGTAPASCATPVPPQKPLAKREACLAPGSPTGPAWGAGAGCSRRARAVKFGGPQVPADSRVLGTTCCLHLLLLPALLPACLSRGWHCVGGTSRLVGTLPW